MKRTALYRSVLILLGAVCLLATPGYSATLEPQSGQAKQIKALVTKAAALIERKGKDAFPELKKKGGPWYKEKTYVFVDDVNGIALVNPPSPEIEGKNVIDMKDAKGKVFVREFIQTAQSNGSGWVEYWWPKPGEAKPSRKMSYIRKAVMPNGEMVIVGAGIYVE